MADARYDLAFVKEISAAKLKARIDAGDGPFILDVREIEELAMAALPSAVHIPMGEIPSRLNELDPERETMVMCHHGVRSAQVAMYLSQMGFAQVLNLRGGIDAWSLDVDPTIPQY